jgi:hypothetical protein
MYYFAIQEFLNILQPREHFLPVVISQIPLDIHICTFGITYTLKCYAYCKIKDHGHLVALTQDGEIFQVMKDEIYCISPELN